jgi:Sensors of blue-light using FAD
VPSAGSGVEPGLRHYRRRIVTKLLRLLYTSTARADLSEKDLADILATAKSRNAAGDITGVLTYRAGRFAQILEGPELNVLEKYVEIARDERHSSVMLITIATTTERRFEGWHMGGILEAKVPVLGEDEILALRTAVQEPADAAVLMSRLLGILKRQSASSA